MNNLFDIDIEKKSISKLHPIKTGTRIPLIKIIGLSLSILLIIPILCAPREGITNEEMLIVIGLSMLFFITSMFIKKVDVIEYKYKHTCPYCKNDIKDIYYDSNHCFCCGKALFAKPDINNEIIIYGVIGK